ncbi:transposase [Desulfosarcina widdelii]|uniref:Transposase n=2 Tax=Desulfosarcina widdelii TaxID=947919 RepID=A0A5K7Z997_9BACT|nr:transposase [Desulfosarcina widdelii]
MDEVPKKVRHLYYKHSTERPSPSLSTVPVPAPKSPSLTTMDDSQREKFSAKTDLLLHYLRTLDAAGHGNKAKARENFVLAYNSGLILQQIYSVLGEVSWKTIEGWKRTLRDGGSLSDQRGKWKRGQSIVTAQQARILLEVALHPNALLVTEIIREATQRMSAAGIDNGHSPSTYRRWLQDFKTHNYDIWCFQRGGKKRWNDECCLAIERDPDLIRVGDVLVADGHKLNFNILNPWTGKPQRMILITFFDMRSNYPCGWEIMPTENTAAISAALRRAILVLGKLPRVIYLDNGKAFRSKYFENTDLEQSGLHGLYQQLGIQTVFAWAYHGQSKTVERFFGTLAELERKSPSYTGTSIEKKPPRLNRGEKLHRKVYEKVVGGETVTLEMAHRVVAAWFDEYVSRPQPRSKYLKGWAPKDLFEPERGDGVDPVALTALMWAKKDAVIRASRISHMGRYYYHDELYGRHHKVEVRYDLQDPGYIAVYEDGNFLCMAPEQDQVHPMANYLGTDQDRELLSQYCEIKRRQEKIAGGLSRKLLESEILPAHQKRLARDGVTATGPVKEPEPKKLTKADERLIEKEAAQYFDRQDRETPKPFIGLDQLDEPDRYEQLVRFDARGVMIPKKWAAFMRYFEQTPQYMRLEESGYWEQVRTNEIVMTEAM